MKEEGKNKKTERVPWKRNTFRILIPVVLAMILYGLSFELFLMPKVEDALIRQKEQTLRELAKIVTPQVEIYHEAEVTGMASRAYVQARALDKLKSLRFGPDFQDYFWVHDTSGVVLMHPTMPQLVGANLDTFPGFDSTYPVRRMTKLAIQKGEGFVRYDWQYLEDSSQVEPKISYVQYYKPWGWIIGNGAYLIDVQKEKASVIHLIRISAVVIAAVLALFVAYLARLTYVLERKRLNEERRKEAALERVNTLRGLLPICAKCKKIRNDEGYWQNVEAYISDHLDTEFSHGLCPDCRAELMDEMKELGINPKDD